MINVQNVDIPQLAISGLDGDLTPEEQSIQESLRDFALNVMRPTGAKLDCLTAEEVIAPSSPIWDYLKQFDTLGLGPGDMANLPPEQLKRTFSIVFEELGYGDCGLAVGAFVMKMASSVATSTGDPELIERFGHLRGCWIATQPDRGSDVLDIEGLEIAAGKSHGKANLYARLNDDEIILNGQSSAWVSCAPIAECALLFCAADYGDGFVQPNGCVNGAVMLVPFDLPGITKGKPLEKLGQRALPQGEVFFDDVRIPRKYLVARQGEYGAAVFSALTLGNMDMASIFTGVARAAFEHALDYAHVRKQGGSFLIDHQLVRWRLFEMWRRVEVARAMSRRATAYNFSSPTPHVLASCTAKITATQIAFDVASDALQMFGGNGLTKEYPLEKLLRDARASLIEDGENHVLALQGANWLSRVHRGHSQSGA